MALLRRRLPAVLRFECYIFVTHGLASPLLLLLVVLHAAALMRQVAFLLARTHVRPRVS